MNVIYPGSFDPITYGHLDIIERCSLKYDKVIVGVLNNHSKKGIFTTDERVELIKECTKEFSNIEVVSFSGLLTEFAEEVNCPNIIRGLRAVSDFEYEMQMALVNRKLYPDLETYFMVSSNKYSFLSSSIVKEVAMLGGNISCFVPKVVEEKLVNKLKGEL